MYVNGYGPQDFAVGEKVRIHLRYMGNGLPEIREGTVLKTDYQKRIYSIKNTVLRLKLVRMGVFVRNEARMSSSIVERTYLYENISHVYKFDGDEWIEYKPK